MWITSLKEFGKFLQKTVDCVDYGNSLIHVIIIFVLSIVLESFVVIFPCHTLPRIQFFTFSTFTILTKEGIL